MQINPVKSHDLKATNDVIWAHTFPVFTLHSGSVPEIAPSVLAA